MRARSFMPTGPTIQSVREFLEAGLVALVCVGVIRGFLAPLLADLPALLLASVGVSSCLVVRLCAVHTRRLVRVVGFGLTVGVIVGADAPIEAAYGRATGALLLLGTAVAGMLLGAVLKRRAA